MEEELALAPAAGGGALFLPGTGDRCTEQILARLKWSFRSRKRGVRPSSSYGEAIVTCRNVAGRALSGLSPSGARGTAPFAAAATGTASFAGAGGGAAAGMDPPAPLTRMLFSMRAASAPLPRAFRPANQRVDVSESDTSAQFHTRSGKADSVASRPCVNNSSRLADVPTLICR